MKEAINLLEKAWDSNADKMEYMQCGNDELLRLSEVNNCITDAVKIIKGQGKTQSTQNFNTSKMDKVRAKFECVEVAKTVNGQTVRMQPVVEGSKENESFFMWTPYGKLEMGTINPDVKFVPGKNYYLDFTEAE